MLARLSCKGFANVKKQVVLVLARGISVQSLLHGSPEAKKEFDTLQHSRLVGRGKYIHGFETHRVMPDKVAEYKKAAEQYYIGIKDDPDLQVKLTGSWETVVGDQDTFLHILEYENYHGFDKTTDLLQHSPHLEAYQAMIQYLTTRSAQLNQEFASFPTAPPHTKGGVFELRSYQLRPGVLLEWENAWRRGIQARRKYISPVGAWFSQIGRLHQVHHMWQYSNLESRKEIREEAWQVDGWAESVSKTASLTEVMDSFVLRPLSFSPLNMFVDFCLLWTHVSFGMAFVSCSSADLRKTDQLFSLFQVHAKCICLRSNPGRTMAHRTNCSYSHPSFLFQKKKPDKFSTRKRALCFFELSQLERVSVDALPYRSYLAFLKYGNPVLSVNAGQDLP